MSCFVMIVVVAENMAGAAMYELVMSTRNIVQLVDGLGRL